MAKLNNLEDFFHHPLINLYNAETHVISALLTMERESSDSDLQEAFSEHMNRPGQRPASAGPATKFNPNYQVIT